MSTSDDLTGLSTMGIHRLLDEAFAGIDMTAEALDLKEEMRGDLVVRTAELERSGLAPGEAAGRAIRDLGDVRSVLAEMAPVAGPGAPGRCERVRPRPGFVVRTVLVCAVGLAGAAVVALAAAGRDIALGGLCAAGAGLAVAAGIVVADSLRQETTGNYPLPRWRAVGYGVASTLALAGAGSAALYLRDRQLPWLVAGALVFLSAIVAGTYLGATQTNRHKPWMVRLQNAQTEAGDRFTRDPAAAARFGIYTATIWTVAFAAFAGLTVAVGWAWSWLALLAGLVVFLMTLARMLFEPQAAR